MDNDMNDFLNDMGHDGMDMMDIMQQTKDEVSAANESRPDLLPQPTMNVTNTDNTFTGKPLAMSFKKTPSPATPQEFTGGITINLAPVTDQDNNNEIMDDDFDDYDAKDDLTKEQQQHDGNVDLARHIAAEMDRVADNVMNVDELEQQYRMTKDPENPNNIFVIKFGAEEEQHWRLPWNPTTNLLCHMEPNKLLIEQSKYNAMYMKYSLSPSQYKKACIEKKKKQMLRSKEKQKKYKVKLGAPIPENTANNGNNGNNTDSMKGIKETRPPTTKFSEDLTDNKHLGSTLGNTLGNTLGTPLDVITSKSGNHLLSVETLNAMDPKQRGTFMMNHSMLVHSEQTVVDSSPTDQDKLMDKIQVFNKQKQPEIPQAINTLNVVNTGHQPEITPITAQIAPELRKLSNDNNKNKTNNNNKQRRVSLTSVGDEEEWVDHEDYSDDTDDIDSDDDDDDDDDDDEEQYDDDDDDDNDNDEKGKKRGHKLGGIQLSVTISNNPNDEQKVERLTSSNEFKDIEETTDYLLNNENVECKLNKQSISGDITGFSPPKISLLEWTATDVWQGILYLGDEWDVFNYIEIMDNSIEYFINCAAGYAAFDYEKKLKYFWLENWRKKREEQRLKQKQKNRIEREKRRKIRLKKFQRAHPEWKPKKKNIIFGDNDDDETHDSKKEIPDLNKVGIEEFALFVHNESPVEIKSKPKHNKKIEFEYNNKPEDIQNEFEYFVSNREEFRMIELLHSSILDLDIDDSDHSSMYDSCLSSSEYEYDSDEYDEYILMSDESIIDKLCPFKFLNIYSHNWEGYRLLDIHMNDVWDFIEQCRMKNLNLKKQWKLNKDHDEDNNKDNNNHSTKPPKVSCLIFCSKNNIPINRLNEEIDNDPNYSLESIGKSICIKIEQYKQSQIEREDAIWNEQIIQYEAYILALNEIQKEKENKENKNKSSSLHINEASINYDMNPKEENEQKSDIPLTPLRRPIDIKNELINKQRIKSINNNMAMYNYKYWDLDDNIFWNDFDILSPRNQALNRLFASSFDRSSTLVLGYMIHSGIRLKMAYKALLKIKANVLRNQSFLRQLIQLDWMKHCFEKPGMREQITFRDEYQCLDHDQYGRKKRHYNLK